MTARALSILALLAALAWPQPAGAQCFAVTVSADSFLRRALSAREQAQVRTLARRRGCPSAPVADGTLGALDPDGARAALPAIRARLAGDRPRAVKGKVVKRKPSPATRGRTAATKRAKGSGAGVPLPRQRPAAAPRLAAEPQEAPLSSPAPSEGETKGLAEGHSEASPEPSAPPQKIEPPEPFAARLRRTLRPWW
jgi:hypothetical protein